ncbi:GNAT family N-acetyltransferase [uncultured Aquitalea sp.]|uniref:GNAT family N-acetyltransferase n=1 Tax=uncultured Aquitalea sp. TaxID=540272 RepID=UPI0025D2E436|nr:GNAT family N-acetyltransferase [uncultured Aquitalea sp.]
MTLTADRIGSDALPRLLPLFKDYLAFYHVTQSDEDCIAYLTQRLDNGEAWVWLAEDAGTAVGFALMYPGFSSLTLKPGWLLHDLFVTPDYRGTGASKLLLEKCQAHILSLGGGDIMLQTAHDNEKAQRLYERNGFELDRDFRVYYWNGREA